MTREQALTEAVTELLATHPAAYRDPRKIDNRTDNAVKIGRAALALPPSTQPAPVAAGEHTPGPWRVGDAGATVFGPPNGTPSPETIASTRRKANARLIAAAPEMLAVLRRYAIEDCCNCSDEQFCKYCQAQDAIARATA